MQRVSELCGDLWHIVSHELGFLERMGRTDMIIIIELSLGMLLVLSRSQLNVAAATEECLTSWLSAAFFSAIPIVLDSSSVLEKKQLWFERKTWPCGAS